MEIAFSVRLVHKRDHNISLTVDARGKYFAIFTEDSRNWKIRTV
jgi:hypothetical protein